MTNDVADKVAHHDISLPKKNIVPTSTCKVTGLWYKRVHNLKVHTSDFY